MNRRSFLKGLLAAAAAPMYIPASRLWLPPERPLLVGCEWDDSIPGLVGPLDGYDYTICWSDGVTKETTIYAAGTWSSDPEATVRWHLVAPGKWKRQRGSGPWLPAVGPFDDTESVLA